MGISATSCKSRLYGVCRKQADTFVTSAPAHSPVASALIPVPVREISPTEEEALMPMPRDVENLADDPNLQNPLQRSERMSTSWFGVSSDLLRCFTNHDVPCRPHLIAVN